MESLGRELINRFPDKKTEDLAHIGSQHLAEPMFKFLHIIEEKTKGFKDELEIKGLS
jgi:hypothetical protein